MFVTHFSNRIDQIRSYLSAAERSNQYDYSNGRVYAFGRLHEISSIAHSLAMGNFITGDECAFIESQCSAVLSDFSIPHSLNPLEDFRFVRDQFSRFSRRF